MLPITCGLPPVPAETPRLGGMRGIFPVMSDGGVGPIDDGVPGWREAMTPTVTVIREL